MKPRISNCEERSAWPVSSLPALSKGSSRAKEPAFARRRFGLRQSSAAFGELETIQSAGGLVPSKTWRILVGFIGGRRASIPRLHPSPSSVHGCLNLRFESQNQRAFTLLELLVVVSIMGILAAVGLPMLKSFGQSTITKNAIQQLQSDLAFARQKAISERTTVYVVFVPPTIVDPSLDTQVKNAQPVTERPRVLQQYLSLCKRPYASYALFTDRNVGSQPGQRNPRYLTEWRSLPENTFVATNKFINLMANSATKNAWVKQYTNRFDVNRAYLLPTRPFAHRNFPVPNARSTNASGVRIEWPMPYVAFDAQGKLFWHLEQDLNDKLLGQKLQSEFIPLARGSVFVTTNAGGVYQPADVMENPPGNSSNLFNVLNVNWLTGRVRLEKPELR
jgi:prepilin-type N-terminal cleavage/methylation domain-containing protein